MPLDRSHGYDRAVSARDDDKSPMWFIGIAGVVLGAAVAVVGLVIGASTGLAMILVGPVILAAGIGGLALDRVERRSRL